MNLGVPGLLLWAMFSVPSIDQPTAQPAATKPQPQAKPQEQSGTTDAAALTRAVIAALDAKDWPKAEELLLKQVDLGQGAFVPYYNLACVRAVQGDTPGAMDWLIKAIERGFCDVHQLRRDSFLTSLRDEPQFRQIIANWTKFLERRVETDIGEAKKLFGSGLQEHRDAKLRIVFLSAANENSSAAARLEVGRIADWCERGVFKGLMSDPAAAEDPWVTVVTPNRDGFLKWSVQEYGPAALSSFSMVGGQYSHDTKQLVSMDSGSTLRHEFFHVLHWRDMTRRGQNHPIYIQEGLASVCEDYDLAADTAAPGGKRAVMATSWRTNIAKRRERGGTLILIDQLAKQTHQKFTGEQPLAKYACARTLFLWVESQGKLAEWYEHYTANYAADPTGVKSFEAVLGGPVADLNKKFRAWVRALPEVPEEILPGKASLGVQVEVQAGDGVAVTGIVVPPGTGQPGSRIRPQVLKGEDGELRVGDVIRSIDGKPTREMAELVRVLGGYDPEQVVELEIRRGRTEVTVKMKLQKK